jgi:Holliday junction DNA helicase RuvA
MIHHVEGVLAERAPGRVIVEVGGVGFELYVTERTSAAAGILGGSVRLLTHLAIREDAWTLYGFLSEEERALYRLLLGVQGVGPRVALAILSGLSPAKLREAVAKADVAALTTISGIGKKTAQRMVVDLRDKIGELPGADDWMAPSGATRADEERDDAVDALVALGYSRLIARDAVGLVRRTERDAPLESIVKDALRRL